MDESGRPPDKFARAFFHKGYGFPPWYSEICRDKQDRGCNKGAIIGDIGFFDSDSFNPVFHSSAGCLAYDNGNAIQDRAPGEIVAVAGESWRVENCMNISNRGNL